MKNLGVVILFCLFTFSSDAESLIPFAPFDQLHVYEPAKTPSSFLILVSGDGGWTRAAPNIAETFSKEGALVVGVDIKKYLISVKHAENCVSVSNDLLQLTHYIQKKFDLTQEKPILIGYSSGATLVYAALAQADPGEFQGALSFGFCPDFEPPIQFCEGHGLGWTNGPVPRSVLLKPSQKLLDPWVAFQGANDQVCDPNVTREFAQQVSTGKFILCPKAGHGFGHLMNWFPEFQKVFQGMK